jgi:lysozyme family protein
MAQFDPCLTYVLSHEGGLSENPSDPGGTTLKGISLRFLREVNEDTLKRMGIFSPITDQTIKDLTDDQISKLYYSEFWLEAPFDKIQNGTLAKYIFDMCVNMGVAQATRLTQRACCAAQKMKDYVKDDGVFGPSTLHAVNMASFMLLPALIAAREGYYRQLVAANEKMEPFLDGWLNRAYDISM